MTGPAPSLIVVCGCLGRGGAVMSTATPLLPRGRVSLAAAGDLCDVAYPGAWSSGGCLARGRS
jgi:hypothetical protein